MGVVSVRSLRSPCHSIFGKYHLCMQQIWGVSPLDLMGRNSIGRMYVWGAHPELDASISQELLRRVRNCEDPWVIWNSGRAWAMREISKYSTYCTVALEVRGRVFGFLQCFNHYKNPNSRCFSSSGQLRQIYFVHCLHPFGWNLEEQSTECCGQVNDVKQTLNFKIFCIQLWYMRRNRSYSRNKVRYSKHGPMETGLSYSGISLNSPFMKTTSNSAMYSALHVS